MKIDFKKLLPHLIAIGVFVIVAIVFCKPAFEGKTLQQHDIVSVNGMSKNALDYKEKFGTLPLWNTNLFSGMPNFQVLIEGPNFLPNFGSILSLGLPKPANFFFLACLCFYLLCIALRTNPYIGIFGALAFAYSTYDPVIISAGHDTKMMAIAYAPALLAGLVWLYERKYWIGLAVTSLFATLEITANHPQINYYFFIAVAFMTLSYIITWVKNKEWKHMAIALSLALVSALIGICNAGVTFLTTYDYAKYTMRGGKTVETSESGTTVHKKTTGLDRDYAFRWSLSKGETVVVLMPNAYGGSSSQTLDENSNVVKKLVDNNVPESNALQMASPLPKYWGGMSGPGEGTSGPPYMGVLVCIIFVVGAVVINSKHKWWILAAVLVGIFMSWGQFFPAFNNFLFNSLPLYNKFRAPSMALVIAQLLVPILAVLSLQQILFTAKTEEFLDKNFKKILYGLGCLIVLLGLVYLMNDYSAPIDKEIIAGYSNAQQGGADIGRMIVSGMMADRKEMFSSDLLRVLGFAVLLAALLYLRRRKIISSLVVVIIIIVISTGDLFITGKKYLGEDNYIEKESYIEANFAPSKADAMILQDKDPHYRVYNLAQDRFFESKTSYYHRSIGGYHAAKLRLYQDLIETQLSKNSINMAVMNMLDTKYFLVPDPQTGNITVSKNDSAMGAAWFVKQVQPVNGPVEEIKALDNFDPAQTAFIDRSQNATVPQLAFDSSATIKLVKYTNDEIEYVSDAKSEQFAVFSEIYYNAGWNAYVDGKKMPHYKVNYLLRGMPVPGGHHTIVFKFEPASYKTGYTMATVGNILLYLFLIGGIYMSFRKKELKYSFAKNNNNV
ncbi:MAG TPA: YfhO family protein [Chitinophagaceae bacterium]|nr:YfhO family protein [Chitinophagaceae bacterium]